MRSCKPFNDELVILGVNRYHLCFIVFIQLNVFNQVLENKWILRKRVEIYLFLTLYLTQSKIVGSLCQQQNAVFLIVKPWHSALNLLLSRMFRYGLKLNHKTKFTEALTFSKKLFNFTNSKYEFTKIKIFLSWSELWILSQNFLLKYSNLTSKSSLGCLISIL